MKQYFKLPASRVKMISFGEVETDYIFEVVKVETNMVGGKGFDAFLDLADPWAWEGAKHKTFCCAVGRGKFVSEEEWITQQNPAPVLEFEIAVFNSDDDRVYNVNGTKQSYATRKEMDEDAEMLRDQSYYVETFWNGEFITAWIPE